MSEQLTCGSLFSGVGGMDIGLAWAGFRHLFFAEIDAYARAVLAARFPGVHIYDDVRAVGEPTGRTEVDALFKATDDGGREAGAGVPGGLDLLCGGFPCQDLSVAGKRAGLAGERSGLFWEAMRIADALRPRAVLLENVEGLYSSNGGRDFGVVLDALAERGYLVTWRTLDAQHFGVPQRRRRVFVCAIADGDLGAERIGEVLALAEGSGGNSPTSDPSWPLPATGARGGFTSSSGVDAVTHTHTHTQRIVPAVTAKWAKGSGGPAGDECQNLIWPSGRDPHSDLRGAVGSGHGTERSRTRPSERSPERERERAGRERADTADAGPTGRQDGTSGTPDRGDGWRAIGVNPSNEDIAGTLPSNTQGGQRTTDIAGAYVVREREREQLAFRKSARARSVTDDETWVDDEVANTLNQFDVGDTRTTHAVVSVGGDVAHTLTKEGHDASEDGTGRGTPIVTYNVRPEYGNGADLRVDEADVHPTLAQQTHLPGYDRGVRVQEQATVRRLTPLECERLMGWPDGWTDIPWNKKDHAPDSRRYAACGNGVVAPVAYWIGARLAEVLK